jgi:cutinase
VPSISAPVELIVLQGAVVGPPTGQRLKQIFGSARVAVQGIDYPALLSTNFLPGGADLGGIAEMRSLLTQAASQCPGSSILAGGYSQGAALVHRAIENLPQSVKDAIDGVVTFGDTQNLQDLGRIPNFPREKLKVFCNVGDLVCVGTLTITAAHLTYGSDANAAADFLATRARAGGA